MWHTFQNYHLANKVSKTILIFKQQQQQNAEYNKTKKLINNFKNGPYRCVNGTTYSDGTKTDVCLSVGPKYLKWRKAW